LKALDLKRQGKTPRVGPERIPLFTFKEPLAVESAFGQPLDAIAVRPFADPEPATAPADGAPGSSPSPARSADGAPGSSPSPARSADGAPGSIPSPPTSSPSKGKLE